MRTTLVALLAVLVPAIAVAQVNTTGTISPNTSVTQVQSPPTGGAPAGPTPAADPTTGVTTATPTAVAPAAAPRDVAIITCGQDFSTGAGQLLVFTASTSAGGPAIAAGAQCAQALSDLFVAGFGIIDVLPFNQQIQYTLVR